MSNPVLIHRCGWVNSDPLMTAYHDKEWGKPLHNDQRLFELLILEGAQAGLSWSTILNRRENYRLLFDGFDPEKMARYSTKKIEKILQDPRIIRNRLKIHSAVSNAKAFLKICDQYDSFDKYIWQFVNYQPKINRWKFSKQIPAKTTESDAMSKALKKQGFSFVGSTICYAFMQATGMVNDHLVSCFRYSKLS